MYNPICAMFKWYGLWSSKSSIPFHGTTQPDTLQEMTNSQLVSRQIFLYIYCKILWLTYTYIYMKYPHLYIGNGFIIHKPYKPILASGVIPLGQQDQKLYPSWDANGLHVRSSIPLACLSHLREQERPTGCNWEYNGK